MRNITVTVRPSAGTSSTRDGRLPRRPGRRYGNVSIPGIESQTIQRAAYGPGLNTMGVGAIRTTRWPR